MISGCMNSNVAQRTSFFGMLRCIGASKQQIVNYVKIHNILYRYDCKCHICVDERVKQAMIPPLIMIVFVENCVKHVYSPDYVLKIEVKAAVRTRLPT